MVSLNQVNEEVDSKYGPFVVEDVPGGDVTLRNPIRLTADERHRLQVMHESIQKNKAAGSDPEKILNTVVELLSLVGVGDGGKRLTDALDGDAAKLLHLFLMYAEAVQLGEALTSES